MSEERHAVAGPGCTLSLVLHLPAGAVPVPCVVACHGLGASKDSDKYLLLGAEFPAAGLALARFDFRGCGESPGREDETTVATRIEDVRAVLSHLARHPRLDGRFGLLGSSLGGFVALHVAAALGTGLPVVTWNAPATLEGLEARPEPTPGIGEPFLAELRAGRHAAALAGVSHHLVVQAEADEVVPAEHGARLHARAAEPRDLVLIAGADHRLSEPAHRKEAVALSLAWFLRFLPPAPAGARPG